MIDKKSVNAYVVKIDGKYYRDDIGNHIDLTEDILLADTFSKKQGAEDTKDYIVRKEWVFGKHDVSVVPITIQEGYGDGAVETLDNQMQLKEKDEEIERLNRISKNQWEQIIKDGCTIAQLRPIINEKTNQIRKLNDDARYWRDLAEQRFEQLQSNTHQVCEKIREKLGLYDENHKTIANSGMFGDTTILAVLDQIEKGEEK